MRRQCQWKYRRLLKRLGGWVYVRRDERHGQARSFWLCVILVLMLVLVLVQLLLLQSSQTSRARWSQKWPRRRPGRRSLIEPQLLQWRRPLCFQDVLSSEAPIPTSAVSRCQNSSRLPLRNSRDELVRTRLKKRCGTVIDKDSLGGYSARVPMHSFERES